MLRSENNASRASPLTPLFALSKRFDGNAGGGGGGAPVGGRDAEPLVDIVVAAPVGAALPLNKLTRFIQIYCIFRCITQYISK